MLYVNRKKAAARFAENMRRPDDSIQKTNAYGGLPYYLCRFQNLYLFNFDSSISVGIGFQAGVNRHSDL